MWTFRETAGRVLGRIRVGSLPIFRPPRTDDRIRILYVGDPIDGPPGRSLPWAEIDSLPSAIQFSLVVVRPSGGTAAAQERLLQRLRDDLSTQSRADTQVLWLLTPDSIDVAVALEIGQLHPLRSLADGEIRTELSGIRVDLESIAFSLSAPRSKAIALASWVRPDGKSRVPVAAMTPDTRWMLLPPFRGDIAATLHSPLSPWLSRRRIQLLSLLLLVLWSAAAVALLSRQRAEYRRQVAEIGSGPFIPAPVAADLPDSAWSGHAQRMATRILLEDSERLLTTVQGAPPGASAYDLWRAAGRSVDESHPYYRLALLAGDLPAAYRIVRELDFEAEGPGFWDVEVTNTVWQAAIESLQELDFDRGRAYTELYLAMFHRMAQGVSSYWRVATSPQRNLTLARILHREIESGRIRSLCQGSDAREAFGWLLGGYGWGYRIPSQYAPDLQERRRRNREKYCDGPLPGGVEYARLPRLSDLRESVVVGDVPIAREPVCGMAGVECRYLATRGALRRDFSATTVDAALGFASDCSYLSDDALADVLVEITGDPDGGSPFLDEGPPGGRHTDVVLPAGKLMAGLACTSPTGSDHYRLLERMLGQLPCDLVGWETRATVPSSSTSSSLVRGLVGRCRR